MRGRTRRRRRRGVNAFAMGVELDFWEQFAVRWTFKMVRFWGNLDENPRMARSRPGRKLLYLCAQGRRPCQGGVVYSIFRHTVFAIRRPRMPLPERYRGGVGSRQPKGGMYGCDCPKTGQGVGPLPLVCRGHMYKLSYGTGIANWEEENHRVNPMVDRRRTKDIGWNRAQHVFQ